VSIPGSTKHYAVM